MTLNESMIHIAMRKYLKNDGWILVAGEFPGGSDDELYVMSIMDPEVACDNSPDSRRHSDGEIIPDLFAYRDGKMLVVEAKPKYSLRDKNKLRNLLLNKKSLLISSLFHFCYERNVLPNINWNNVRFIPTLAFENSDFRAYSEEAGFAHLYVSKINHSKLVLF